jgi:hypothetical protein
VLLVIHSILLHIAVIVVALPWCSEQQHSIMTILLWMHHCIHVFDHDCSLDIFIEDLNNPPLAIMSQVQPFLTSHKHLVLHCEPCRGYPLVATSMLQAQLLFKTHAVGTTSDETKKGGRLTSTQSPNQSRIQNMECGLPRNPCMQ